MYICLFGRYKDRVTATFWYVEYAYSALIRSACVNLNLRNIVKEKPRLLITGSLKLHIRSCRMSSIK